MKKCNGCEEELIVGENWLASREKYSIYKCNDCRNKYESERKDEKAKYDKTHRVVYRHENRGKVNALTAKRRAAKLERTPPWLTKEHLDTIQAFYDWADYLNGPHEVDHMVPLQGKNVSGLHVPWNLEVLSKSDHEGKGNKHVP